VTPDPPRPRVEEPARETSALLSAPPAVAEAPSAVAVAPPSGPITESVARSDAAAPTPARTDPGPPVTLAPPPAPAPARVTQAARPHGGYQVRPTYPVAARRAGAEGTTMLRVHIRADGAVDEVQVSRSAGHVALDDAAAAAVARWRFEPARNGSDPVAVWVLIPVEFRIQGAE
jgi:protein TonB